MILIAVLLAAASAHALTPFAALAAVCEEKPKFVVSTYGGVKCRVNYDE